MANFDASGLNRPYLDFDWIDEDHAYLSVGYGTRHGDSVVNVTIDFQVPSWLSRILP